MTSAFNTKYSNLRYFSFSLLKKFNKVYNDIIDLLVASIQPYPINILGLFFTKAICVYAFLKIDQLFLTLKIKHFVNFKIKFV